MMPVPSRTLSLVPAAVGWLLVATAPAPAQDLPLLDWTSYVPQLERLASDRLGREVEIEAIEIVEPSLTPLLRLRGVRVANADWGEAEHLAEIEELRVRVDLLALLRGEIVVPELTLVRPRLALARNEAGEANWTFAGLGDDKDEDGSPTLPVIRELRVTNAELSFEDEAADLDLSASLASLTGKMADQAVTLAADGSLGGRPLSLSFDGGGVEALRAADRPYPSKLRLALADTELTAQGTVTDPLRGPAAADLRLEAAGPTLATLGLGTFPVPDTPPYRLDGRLTHESDTWRLGDVTASLGDSRALGWAEVSLGGERPMVRADILATELHARDFLTDANDPPAEAAGPLFPDTPVPTDWLHLADAVVHFRAEAPDLPGPPIDLLDVRLTVRDGRLEANPLELQVAAGKVTGEVALNGRRPIPSADMDLAYEDIRLKRAFRGTRFADETTGTLRGQLYLLGTGETVADLADSLRGHAALVMDDGTLSGLLIEGVGLDVAEALALYIGGDTRVPVRCAVAGLEVDAGVATIRRLGVDTKDSVIRGQGSIDLGAETLDLRLKAQGKDFSLLDPDAPVFVQGDLQSPGISVGGRVVIPQLELGLQGNAPCDRLTEQVMALGRDAGQG
ncbi:MAG: AsmA family protein [Ilumatobacteraceae bacterium]